MGGVKITSAAQWGFYLYCSVPHHPLRAEPFPDIPLNSPDRAPAIPLDEVAPCPWHWGSVCVCLKGIHPLRVWNSTVCYVSAVFSHIPTVGCGSTPVPQSIYHLF